MQQGVTSDIQKKYSQRVVRTRVSLFLVAGFSFLSAAIITYLGGFQWDRMGEYFISFLPTILILWSAVWSVSNPENAFASAMLALCAIFYMQFQYSNFLGQIICVVMLFITFDGWRAASKAKNSFEEEEREDILDTRL